MKCRRFFFLKIITFGVFRASLGKFGEKLFASRNIAWSYTYQTWGNRNRQP